MADAELGARTAADIHSAPEVALSVLDRLDTQAAQLARRASLGVRFLGCGSSYLGGGVAAGLLQRLAGVTAEAVVGSEPAFYAPRLPPAPLAIAISRSGATSETLAAVHAHREAGGGPVVALVCDPASPLAEVADQVVAVPEAGEEVVAQTRSVAVFLTFSVLLAGHSAGLDPHPAVRAALQDLAASRAVRAAAAASTAAEAQGRVVALGGGQRWWLARETALKCMEMGRVPVDAERVMEFPHGPVEALDEDTTVVAFRTAAAARVEGPVLDRLATIAARVVRLGSHADCDPFSDAARLLADLHDGQLLALQLARARGIDTDKPARLSTHVTLDAS